MVDFVNPYTFIPLPTRIERTEPNRHLRLEHYAGTLRVTLTAATPLIIREGDQTTNVPTKNGKVVIRGSALHGAIRSMHETLAGGCLRVIGPKYVPSYRQVVEARLEETTMALVETVDDEGAALTVRLCDQETWIDAGEMHRALGPVDCGEKLYVREDLLLDLWDRRNARYEIGAGLVRGQGGWIARQDNSRMANPVVAFITDIGARSPRRGHYWAVGPLTDKLMLVSKAAREAYAASVAGTNDVRLAAGQPNTAVGPTAQVARGTTVFGRRYVAGGRLQVGQPIWVVTTGDGEDRRVSEIRLAKVWRQAGAGALEERVGDFLPCSDRTRSRVLELCPSCSVFGAAEEREPGLAENDESVQLSYAGHVFVGDALSRRPKNEIIEPATSIAPLMGPHPGSGHFYLQPAAESYRGETVWGAAADNGAPRGIRGRKFYWRARPQGGQTRPLRAVPRGPQNTERAISIRPLRRGTEFVVDIQFVNITEEQLGGLAAAIKPDLLFDSALLSVGGGKPFGFGAVAARIELAALHTAAQRYGTALALDRTGFLDQCVATFRAGRDASGAFRAVDRAAAHVLRLDFVSDDLISYPFDGSERHARTPEPGYKFFKAARGGRAGNAPRPLYLPDPGLSAEAQQMNNQHGGAAR